MSHGALRVGKGEWAVVRVLIERGVTVKLPSTLMMNIEYGRAGQQPNNPKKEILQIWRLKAEVTPESDIIPLPLSTHLKSWADPACCSLQTDEGCCLPRGTEDRLSLVVSFARSGEWILQEP